MTISLGPGDRLTTTGQLIRAAGSAASLVATEPVAPPIGPAGDVAELLMHSDGELVAYGPSHSRIWATPTRGNPGATARLDGSQLAVIAPNGETLFGGTLFDWQTVKSTDATGYDYDETSPDWKTACESLPCFADLCWPGYQTLVTTPVGVPGLGPDIIVQLWRGRCQRFFGLPDFPGGIGGEVGIYRRDPTRGLDPATLLFRNPAFGAMALARSKGVTDLWWAAPDLGTTLEFAYVNPLTQTEIFRAGPEQTYWRNLWMYPDGYARYGAAQGPAAMPQSASHCILRYSINGVQQPDWGVDATGGVGYDPVAAEAAA